MSGRFNLNDYVTVDERIDQFWARYPNGAIRTEMLYTNNDGSNVAIKASVYKDWEHPASNPDATGIAQELQGGANANKSSWWENCETSAIGRALANLGMSISKQRPSREEMAKVQRYQDEQPDPLTTFDPRRPQDRKPAPPTLDTDQVLTILGEMNDSKEPWHEIKRYADDQSAGRAGDDVLRIHDKLRAIASGRKAKAPAGVAG